MSVDPAIVRIESEMFTPALQKAMQQAQDDGHGFNESVLGASNAYINMLVELVGKEQAKKMLQDQVKFLESQRD